MAALLSTAAALEILERAGFETATAQAMLTIAADLGRYENRARGVLIAGDDDLQAFIIHKVPGRG